MSHTDQRYHVDNHWRYCRFTILPSAVYRDALVIFPLRFSYIRTTQNHNTYATKKAITYPSILLLTILVIVLLVANTLNINNEVLTGIPYLVSNINHNGAIACHMVNASGNGIPLVVNLPREMSHPVATQLHTITITAIVLAANASFHQAIFLFDSKNVPSVWILSLAITEYAAKLNHTIINTKLQSINKKNKKSKKIYAMYFLGSKQVASIDRYSKKSTKKLASYEERLK